MGLSESLRTGAVESRHGSLVSRLGIHRRRRLTYFFGDIFFSYLQECEHAFPEDVVSMGREWMSLYFNTLVPGFMKRLPLSLLNMAMRRVWINVGLMDDFSMDKQGELVTIRTRNEAISKSIGSNGFSVGLFLGIVDMLYGKAETVSVKQSNQSEYVFRIAGAKACLNGKTREEYDRLNNMPESDGFSLVSALKKRIVVLGKDNRIYFRGRPLYPVENTIFHVIGSKGILLEKVPAISFGFFKESVDAQSSPEQKLLLLKTLLQAMGWGRVSIASGERKIVVEISDPPYGLQKQDSWRFLSMTILGYLRMIGRFSLKSERVSHRKLSITYAR